MAAQYDSIADQYDMTFQLIPARQHVEAFSVFQLLGNVKGLSMLDAACGTGAYTRELRRRGASRVLGVDVSPEMIKVACSIEEQEPLGVEYAVHDVAAMDVVGVFDAALAIYMIHYAPTQAALLNMCQGIVQNITSGARFIAYHLNPDMPTIPGYYQQYGLSLRLPETISDGSELSFSVTAGDFTSPEFTIYYWSKPTIKSALEEVGFTDVRWVMPTVSEQGINQYGSEYWQTYLAAPHCILLECRKV
jgi:ubiquinone/menaquinone biosynthesis C-methylase UbiE